jgi:hypothetical protein
MGADYSQELLPHGGLSEAIVTACIVCHTYTPAPAQMGSVLLVIQSMNISVELVPPLSSRNKLADQSG